MRGRTVVAACLAAGLLAPAWAAASDEPFWNARPLGYWLNQLRVGDAAARELAARGVNEIATAHGSATVTAAVPLLMPCLDAADAPLRAAAADALAPIGAAALSAGPRLLTMFEHDPDPGVRRSAGVAATRVVPGSSTLVTVAGRVLLRDDDSSVRQVAAASLVEAGSAATPALAAAQRALADGDPMVRVYSAAVVARLGGTAEAVPVLLSGLTGQDSPVRAESAGLLADVAPADVRLVPALVTALKDDDRLVRIAAADALGTIGPPARIAIDPLWHMIRDPDDTVREHALRALRLIKG